MKAAASALAVAEQELNDAEETVRARFRQYGSESTREVMEATLAAIKARSAAWNRWRDARRQVAQVTP